MYSNSYIAGFAASVCVFCSIFVSGSAVVLKDRQVANAQLDLQKNVAAVSGLVDADKVSGLSPEDIKKLFDQSQAKHIKEKFIVLESGEETKQYKTAEEFEAARKAAKKQGDFCQNKRMDGNNPAQIRCLPKEERVYEVYDEKGLALVILPIEGKGLWSTLKGFLAMEKDGNKIAGITFYSHAETPGLGGEVDNPDWKAKWKGKIAYAKGAPKIKVAKGDVDESLKHQVDGLSGATITSNGVTNLVQFWLGDIGYKKYLATKGT